MLLKLLSPLNGWCTALDEVPDEVFAGHMLGDGLAVDPTSGLVLAPCDGVIMTLPQTRHAVSIRSPEGIDVLIHIGIDTVQLTGDGFAARVKPGDKVKAGDELIRFDLDVAARRAKSLMTPIVVTSDGMTLENRRVAGMVKAGDLLFEIGAEASVAPQPSKAAGVSEAQQVLVVTLRQGLHARPAALLARRAKTLDAQISLAAHGRSADARSVVAIMALGVRHGDELALRAQGREATQAIAAMVAAIAEAQRLESAHAPARQTPISELSARDGELLGVPAVAGFAVGRAARIERREIEVIEFAPDARREQRLLEQARLNVRARLERVGGTGDAARREIIAAHLEFLDDPTLNESAQQLIAAGKSAAYAWRHATRRSIDALLALEDVRLRERADDLLDVEAHVLLALAGEARPMHLPLPEQAVRVDVTRPAASGCHCLERWRCDFARGNPRGGDGNSHVDRDGAGTSQHWRWPSADCRRRQRQPEFCSQRGIARQGKIAGK
jgi:phosphocarrier protein FPr/phosphocarrier protein